MRWLIFRTVFSRLDRELYGADEPFRAEIATSVGFGQTVVDQVAAEPICLRSVDPWSTHLGPHKPKRCPRSAWIASQAMVTFPPGLLKAPYFAALVASSFRSKPNGVA